jgi:hypothetical protein
VEKAAWKSFINLITIFLNHKAVLDDLLESYKTIGSNMYLKVHFLDSNLVFFLENLGTVSDEHGDRFHRGNEVPKQMDSQYVGWLFLDT